MIRFAILLILFFHYNGNAQVRWVNAGTIIFEEKTKVNKSDTTLFDTQYFSYSFSNNKSVYTYDAKMNTGVPKNLFTQNELWYSDYTQKQMTKAFIFQSEVLLKDSLPSIKWKYIIGNQTVISGFKCRKAMTILFDSVYAYVFYTDEITIPGGPMSLHGLPGMILGVTIPRLNTSWIATSVSLTIPKTAAIVPPKNTKTISRADLLQAIKSSDIFKNSRQAWYFLL